MSKFRYRMYQFMQGRRGPDQFTRFLIMASALLFLISVFVFRNIAYYLGIALLLYGNYRMFSRNIPKREQENNWFLAQKYKFAGGRTSGGRQQYDVIHYRYFKCPACGQKIRAPKGKGKIKITCQNCHTQFQKKV